ncbi:MAG: hypothetical protein ACYDAY_05425 [Candidatus Dormibacteria bacterium]
MRICRIVAVGALLVVGSAAVPAMAAGAGAGADAFPGQGIFVSNIDPSTGCNGYTVIVSNLPQGGASVSSNGGVPSIQDHPGLSYVDLWSGNGTVNEFGECDQTELFNGDPGAGQAGGLVMDPSMTTATIKLTAGGNRVNLTGSGTGLPTVIRQGELFDSIVTGSNFSYAGIDFFYDFELDRFMNFNGSVAGDSFSGLGAAGEGPAGYIGAAAGA